LTRICLLVALVIAGAVAACGGGGSEEDEVVEAVEASATSRNPEDCVRLATQSFLEQTQVLEGADAVAACERDAEEADFLPDSVEVSAVEVHGSKATANAAFNGGPFDGQTLAVALVEAGGTWKMDEIVGFAEFHRAALLKAMGKGLEKGQGAFDPEVAACLGEEFEELSRGELEEILIGGSLVPLEELVEGCT